MNFLLFFNLGDFDLDFDLGDFGVGDFDLGDFGIGDFDLGDFDLSPYCRYSSLGNFWVNCP